MYQVIKKKINYCVDPIIAFANLASACPMVLLESAEIDSKNATQSLLMVDGALKIVCKKQQVSISALTNNGKKLLPLLANHLKNKTLDISITDQKIELIFAEIDLNLDEDERLKLPSVFDPLRTINQLLADQQNPSFLLGLFSYDLVFNFIPLCDKDLPDDGLDSPDYVFYLAEQLIRFDHQNQSAELISFVFDKNQQAIINNQAEIIISRLDRPLSDLPKKSADNQIKVNYDDEAFKQKILQMKQNVFNGDVFQIVPSRRFSINCSNPLLSYQLLKKSNPSPYMFYLQDDDFVVFGASPESALKFCAENRELEIYPIAGSRPRGFNQAGEIDVELDLRIELDLRLDKKEISEHLMLVDLARNDAARVCEKGSRQVVELMQINRYSHIMHLVSKVAGKLRNDLDALHAYQACMNMGTLTGAPKVRAMQLLHEYENQRRHSFGGAIGYLASNGDFDSCIVIRSAFVQNKIAHIQAGCGVVLDSDLQSEANETFHKARAVLNAIQKANN